LGRGHPGRARSDPARAGDREHAHPRFRQPALPRRRGRPARRAAAEPGAVGGAHRAAARAVGAPGAAREPAPRARRQLRGPPVKYVVFMLAVIAAPLVRAEGWSYSLTPYVWLPNINGTLKYDVPEV